MATQFTGNDKANLLSTALEANSGDNIAITSTSDAVAQGLDGKDTIVLGKNVSSFTASGGVDADTILVSGNATGSDIQGNRGDDTIRVTGQLTNTAVKGGLNADTIHISNDLTSSSVFSGDGNDTITFDKNTADITGSLFQDGADNNKFTITSQGFTESTVNGGSGIDEITLTVGNGIKDSSIQAGSSNDKVTINAGITRTAIAGGSGNDETVVTGAVQASTLYGGEGNDSITLTVGANELDQSVIQDGAGNNVFKVTSTSTVEGLTVNGGSGNDSLGITANTEDLLFKGSADNDSVKITGTLTSSTLYGGSGTDEFEVTGATTSSVFQSGSGKNTYTFGDAVTATVNGGSGVDNIAAGANALKGAYTLGDGKDVVTAGAIDATIKMGAGDDQVNGTTLTGKTYLGTGANTITLTDKATDALVQAGGSDNNTFSFDGADTITIVSGDGNDKLTDDGATKGFTYADATFGGGKDTVDLKGKLDNSLIRLGSGKDDFDLALASTSSTIYGGEGDDAMDFAEKVTKFVVSDTQGKGKITFVKGLEETTVTTGGSADTVANTGTNTTKLSSVDLGAGNDTLTTGAVAFEGSTITAGEGADSIKLGAGVAKSGTTTSAIYLGAGNDTLITAGGVEGAEITTASGDNLIDLSSDAVNNIGAASDVNITLGSGADTLGFGYNFGDSSSSAAVIGAKTTIKLGGGNDRLIAGDNGSTGFTLYGGEGTDTVSFTEATATGDDAFFANASSIEHVEYVNSNDDDLTLGAKAQAAGVVSATVNGTTGDINASGYTSTVGLTLTAGTGTSDLTGGDGADSLVGGAGVNTIKTSEGNDTITGGAGDDVFEVDGDNKQTVAITDFGTGGNESLKVNANATVNATISVAGGVTADDVDQKGIVNVTITDGVNGGSTVSFANVGGGAGEKGFNITASANDNGITITGSQEADTVVAGGGADILTGGIGADTITGGEGADDFLMTDVVAAGAVSVDKITDFTVSHTDQIGNYGATNLEGLAALGDLNAADDQNAIAGGNLGASVTKVSAAYDLGTAGTGSILALSSTTAFTNATVADALETGGALALTMNNQMDANDGIIVLFDNNTDTTVGLLTTGANIANDAKAAANDFTMTTLTTLSGVADASTIATANLLDFLA